jgi:hypothetical protein
MLAVLATWEPRAKQIGLSAEDRAELESAFATSLPHTGANSLNKELKISRRNTK